MKVEYTVASNSTFSAVRKRRMRRDDFSRRLMRETRLSPDDFIYPVFVLELNRNETDFGSMDEIVDHLKQQIESSEMGRLIGVFDHYRHTRNLRFGQIDADILARLSVRLF